ncbi:MAG: NAD(P)-dependent oxidoreductase [Chloroflexota bacterium]
MRKVLLTGASGKVGSAFLRYAGEHYDLRLVDRDISRLVPAPNYEIVEANLVDMDACQRVCTGIDTVLHLAADPSPAADFYGSLLDNNVKAMYNMFQAAKDQGCQRIIFASSIQVIEGYPLDVQPTPQSPIKPRNLYAVCKAMGEAMAHHYAYAEGLSSIAVRVGAFGGNQPMDVYDGRRLSAYVSERDMTHLFVCCIERPDIQFAILHAVSDNRFKRMDITSTKEIVGYQPQDDAFQVFETGIPYGKRWFDEEESR